MRWIVSMALLVACQTESEEGACLPSVVESPGDPLEDKVVDAFVVEDGMAPFHLSGVPLLDTAEVSVEDAQLVYLFVETDWVYDPAPNAIAFIAFVPSPGMQVRVAYHTEETLAAHEDMLRRAGEPARRTCL